MQLIILLCYSIFFLQASSDLSILDFDIPFSLGFVCSSTIELLMIIIVMASVTWQVLIVAVFAAVASKYVQVTLIFTLATISLIFDS